MDSKYDWGGGGRKFRRAENTDRISNLPECIISHILSCLPTKDAVRTSVLSKAWEYKWNSMYNIDLNDSTMSRFFPGDDEEQRFSKFMDGILFNLQNIRSFRLCCCRKKFDRSRLRTWISTVFRRNVEIVDIFALCEPDSIILSRSLLNCTSIRILKLNLCCTLKVSVKTCFRSLTTLDLYRVQILNDNSNTDMLAFDLPVLETLVICGCKWLNVRFVEFCAPSLTSFVSEISNDTEADNCIIKILGARLDEFQTRGLYPGNYLLVGSTVVCAKLMHFYHTDEGLGKAGLQFRRLLKEFSSLEELKLSCYTIQAIAHTKSGLHLPRYDKLRRLDLSYDFTTDVNGDVETLVELLHAAPCLKLLDIDTTNFIRDGGGEYDYEAIDSVPSCIVSHLEEVKLNSFSNMACQLDLAVFLLVKGAKLKKCSISLAEWSEMGKDELADKLSGLPKASASITIVVT